MILTGFSKLEEPPRRRKCWEEVCIGESRPWDKEGLSHVDVLVQGERESAETGFPGEAGDRCVLESQAPWATPLSLPLFCSSYPLSLSGSLLCKPNCPHLFEWADSWWQLGKFAPLLDKWGIKLQRPGTAERLLPPTCATKSRTKEMGMGKRHLWHWDDCPQDLLLLLASTPVSILSLDSGLSEDFCTYIWM